MTIYSVHRVTEELGAAFRVARYTSVVMGLGIVLLLWLVVGTVLTAIGAAILAGTTGLLTRGITNGRRKVIIAAALLPFVCLCWAGVVFVFQAVINEGLLHRDLGLGDTWHAPLPNGYQIMMIDVTDQGMVYNPKTQPGARSGRTGRRSCRREKCPGCGPLHSGGCGH
jgi:hypothetical protein